MRNRLFNSIRVQVPKSNVFDLSHEKKLSCNMGELIPIYIQEVLPGDKFRGNSEIFVRVAPLVAPMMHRVNVYCHFFFVPNRLIWDKWEKFITGDVTGLDASVHPYLNYCSGYGTYFDEGSLADYMGLPPVTDNDYIIKINSLPFRAYQKIYNDYYRDQSLVTEVDIHKDHDGAEAAVSDILELRFRSWEKDYFTSALTDTQRGGDVILPSSFNNSGVPNHVKYSDGSLANIGALKVGNDGHLIVDEDAGPDVLAGIEDSTLGIAVNDLRTSARLQEWLEKQARGGSRYIETILNHWGFYTKDSRLQRSEYIGGGKQPLVISEVLNTSDTASAPQGNMAGHGVSVGKTNSFKKRFEEHGWLFGIMSVLPRTAYQSMVERHFFKENKYDYAWPSLANLGEQPIYNKEIFPVWHNAVADANDAAWGYQSRYSEYKFKQSSVHGAFRSSLYHWHMGRIFASLPTLNSTFVNSDPTHRVFAVTTSTVDKLYVQIYNNIQAIRALPKYGTPRL